MSTLLSNNQTMTTDSGQTCTVLKWLASGGQGEVYKVDRGGQEYALKWYFEQNATDQQHAVLQELVNMGSPGDRFLWPLDLVSAPGTPGFGYIMGLIPDEYRKLHDLVYDRIRPQPKMTSIVTMTIELAKAFRNLHIKGLCYRDISFGNAFFRPDTGEILICDNDNVTANRSGFLSVLGTPDFMAPEIVRGEAAPSTKTDLHSLAVLLFYVLHIGHPLQGRRMLSINCWDAPAQNLLFGKEPVFIFDPTNRTNEAVSLHEDPTGECGGHALRYWNLFPGELRKTFIKAFTDGLRDPDRRVTELEWLTALTSLRDSIFACQCGSPNFYDLEKVRANGGQASSCWSCKTTPRLPFRIRIGRGLVMLNAGTQLFPHHIEGRGFDLSTPVAEVVQHPTNPQLWGLQNQTSQKWVVTFPNGTQKDVDPGRSAPLSSGNKINFGMQEGEIRY